MSHETVNVAQMGAHLSEPKEVTASRTGRHEWEHLGSDSSTGPVMTDSRGVSMYQRKGLFYNAHSGARMGA